MIKVDSFEKFKIYTNIDSSTSHTPIFSTFESVRGLGGNGVLAADETGAVLLTWKWDDSSDQLTVNDVVFELSDNRVIRLVEGAE